MSMKNLLDPNGYIEAVIRRTLDTPSGEELAEKIIDRLRGDSEEIENTLTESYDNGFAAGYDASQEEHEREQN